MSASSASLDRGDIVNLLGRLRDRLREQGDKITVVQNRLIMRRIEEGDVLAGADITRTNQQIDRIASIVADIVGMGEELVKAELRACRG